MTALIVVGGKKHGATCSPLFTLLRDDVTRSPAPHVALPGNMKGSEQEALQWPKEQTAARRGPKNCQNQRCTAPWRTPTKVKELKESHLLCFYRKGGFFRRLFLDYKKVSKLANFVR